MINIDNSEVEVRRCSAIANRKSGFLVRQSCERIYFLDCIARENGLTGNDSDGFQGMPGPGDTPVTFVAIRCIAEDNWRHGFNADRTTAFIFEGCLAQNNTEDGFNTEGDEVGLMKECTALGNKCGFDNQGTTALDQPVTYVANYAADNTVAQYCNKGMSHNTFPYCTHLYDDDDAQFWRNIRRS